MVTADEVDAFFKLGKRTLPASPDWRIGNRAGERRTSLPIALDGALSLISLELTVRLQDPEYLMMLLLADSAVICRLCMTTGHWDRLAKTMVDHAHFHSWEGNRGKHKTIPKKLNHLEKVPEEIAGKDAAFIWFLQRNGIELPDWLPPVWPHGSELI